MYGFFLNLHLNVVHLSPSSSCLVVASISFCHIQQTRSELFLWWYFSQLSFGNTWSHCDKNPSKGIDIKICMCQCDTDKAKSLLEKQNIPST